jgi:hypothetical protein
MPLKSEDFNEIYEQVKANHSRLRSCPGPHDFQAVEPGKVSSRYKCTKCNGDIDPVHYKWYMDGLRHGKL